MVFDTIRTGFPTAELIFQVNSDLDVSGQIWDRVQAVNGVFAEKHSVTIHHEWIGKLLTRETEPFWLCDTDVMFWESVEGWRFQEAMAGRRIPQFQDDFTGAITRPRLHPSLLYIEPLRVKKILTEWLRQFPVTVFNPFADMVNPLCVPFKGKAHFYDTLSMLYHAIGGQSFTEAQLDCYDHMNFGTIEDLVLPRLVGGEGMRGLRELIYNTPIRGKGMWRQQEEYFRAKQA